MCVVSLVVDVIVLGMWSLYGCVCLLRRQRTPISTQRCASPGSEVYKRQMAPVRKVGARLSPLAREWGPVLFLSLLPAMPLLLGSGIVNTRAGGDSPFLLIRLQQLAVNLRNGIFPVRWMPQAAYGLGYPFFNFYASLPYYIAALLKLAGLGYLLSIKFTQDLGFVLAGMAMYSLLKNLGRYKLASLFGYLTCG